MADKPDDTVELSIKIPAHLHKRLGAFCTRDNMKVEELVSDLINKWLLVRRSRFWRGRERAATLRIIPGLPIAADRP